MGSSHAAGSAVEEKVESNTITINWLAADIRKNLINIETLAQVVEDVRENITSNIETFTHTVEELSENNKKDDNQDQKLDDIHSTLLDIGNALSLDFANRIAGMKEQEDELKGAKSRRRFKREESQLEKSSKKVGNVITRTGSKMIAPFQDIFGKIISFLGVLGTGIVVNEAFKWLSDPENQAKIGKFFKILKENWKWIVGTIGAIVAAKLVADLVIAVGLMAKLFAFLSSPAVLAVIIGLAGGKLLVDNARKREKDKGTGRFYEGRYYYPDDPMYDKIPDLHTKSGGMFGQIWDFLKGKGDKHQITPKTLYRKPGTRGPDDPGVGVGGPNDPNKFHTGGYTGETGGMVHPREYVLREEVVNKIGINKLDNLNRVGKLVSSISKSGINLIPIDLPAITAKMPEISTPSGPATEAPDIASTNGADQYRHITSSIYGIFV